ncbi:hypothetical protein WJX72_004051 [[Myrmecia] bisecta]|uniref:PX domain-containing protein n=1 Tax=[Myrmecia] bisecta TaxID=41462 RepID=A0AAW1PBV5_9CHLO
MSDPLSNLAFASVDEELHEEPIDDGPHEESAADKELRQQYLGYGAGHDSEHLDTRTDTVASYGQLLAPPSYADSVLFDRGEIQPEGLDVPESSSAPKSARALQITVTDPVKKVESSIIPGVTGGYFTYRVATKTTLPHFGRKELAVRRRFRDFVALADLLKITHRGYFIPPRPEKSAIDNQRATPDFIEIRRAALEHYLEQLAAHPVISTSQELRVFLEEDGALSGSQQWAALQPMHGSFLEGVARLPKQLFGQDRAIPAPFEAAQSTKNTSDLLRRFKEMGQSYRNEYKEPPALPDDEVNLRNERLVIDEFAEKVAIASRKAEKVVSKFEDVGNVLGDLGLSLIKIAKFEEEEGTKCGQYTESAAHSKTISADAKRFGMASVRLSRLSRTATAQTTVALSPLHDHLALTPAVLKALKEREAALVTAQAIAEDLEKKRKSVGALEEQGDKRFGGDKNATRKVANLQNDVAALEAALQAAQAEYDRVKTRNNEELERWTRDRASDFAAMLEGFARVEGAFQDRSLDIWRGVAEEFGASQQPGSGKAPARE